MASFQPFQPNVKQASAGVTVNVVTSAASSSVSVAVSAGQDTNSMLVTNWGSNVVYVRLTLSTDTQGASTTDTPMLGNTTRLFANPSPNGTALVAVTTTVSTANNTVFITPGQGGTF